MIPRFPKWIGKVQAWARKVGVFVSLMWAGYNAFYFKTQWVKAEGEKDALQGEVARLRTKETQRMVDSLNFIQRQEAAKMAFKNRLEIVSEAKILKSSLKYCNGVNYYTIHNGGDVIKADGKWVLEVYVSTEQAIEEDYPEDGIKTPVYQGWAWLNSRALETGLPNYVADVSKEPKIMQGKAGEYLKQAGIKACVVMLVENFGSELHFVSFNFTVENPAAHNPDLFEKVYHFRRYVRARI